MKVKDIPLIGGHPVLDFANSWESPGRPNEVNYLPDYAALAEWAQRVGILTTTGARRLMRRARENPSSARAAWQKAVALRTPLLGLLHAVTARREAAAQDITMVNAAIAEALQNRRLAATSDHLLSWSWKTPDSPDVILWALALGASELLTDRRMKGRVKTCARGSCDWVFLDLSHAGRRRWCRMAVCGSADKVRRFRERQRRVG